MKKSRFLASLMTVIFAGTLLMGCSDKPKEPESTNTEQQKEENAQKGTAEQKIIYNIGADPKTIDPQLNAAVDGSTIIHNAFEGLMREDADGKIVPGVAKSVDISEDKTVYTFHLRDDAKWSDGKSVVANDFIYAWTRALTPDLAAEYAAQLFYIKNASAYYKGLEIPETGEIAKLEDVGMKALDDHTVEVTLESPTAYFLSLAAFPTYFPVRKDVVEASPEKWALSPKTYISNGPFKMSDWKVKESITFVKNDNYWNKDKVKLQELEIRLIDDQKTYLNAFRSDELDIIESPPTVEMPGLLADGTAVIYPNLGTYFYVVNVGKEAANVDPEAAKVLSNPKVRKALTLAIDKELIVEKVTQGGQKAATAFVPPAVLDSDAKEFHKDYFKGGADIEEAKKLLAEAGYPNGEGMPTITLTFNTNEGHQNIAQAVQDMWKNNLGVNIELKNEEWAVFQETRNKKQFVLARHGWVADYNDPMSFLDMWTTDNGNNDAAYSNPEYDKLIAEGKKETNGAKRTEILHKAEDILMEDMPVIPVYSYTNIICAKPKVKDIIKSPLGQMNFIEAYVEE